VAIELTSVENFFNDGRCRRLMIGGSGRAKISGESEMDEPVMGKRMDRYGKHIENNWKSLIMNRVTGPTGGWRLGSRRGSS
jgi:hypothetical protein